jgi:GT2 family glycosyltransferase
MKSIAVLVTCHNRKEKTNLCLEALFKSKMKHNVNFQVYLVDDGSTDGTSQLMRSKYPEITILTGDGNLFWNRGMHTAYKEASKKDYDFYLWLNDDTNLIETALSDLVETWNICCINHHHDRHIVIGSTCDPADETITTYGGVRKKRGLHPFRYTLITPNGKLQYADTMNGNIVLIPRSVYNVVGNLDFTYSHSMGDFDYGHRARRAGCNLIVAPGFLGKCGRNSVVWQNNSNSLKQKLRKKLSIKELPFNDWKTFCLRNGGMLWPLWTITPYARFLYKEIYQNAINQYRLKRENIK